MVLSTGAVLAGVLAAVVLFTILGLCCFLFTRRICKTKKTKSDLENLPSADSKVAPDSYKVKIEGSPLDPETAIVMTRQQTDARKSAISPGFTGREIAPRSVSCLSLTLPRPNLRNSMGTPQLPMRFSTMDRQMTPRRPTSIESTLVYITKDSQLNVYVHRFLNLPLRHGKKYFTYITVRLNLPKSCLSKRSKSAQKSLNPEYAEVFQFKPVHVEDLSLGFLEVLLHAKRKMRFKEVGIWRQNLKELGLDSGQPIVANAEIEVDAGDSDSEAHAAPKYSNADMGQLLISLQYQSEAGRLKVFVRKADGLPDSRGLMSPEYFVVLNVTSASGSADVKETKQAKGRRPIWNEAFLFDIKPHEIGSCWLHLTVLRKKHYSHDMAVGHVTLGHNSTPDGEQHWKALLEPRSMEVTQWHRLTPR